MAMKLFGKGGVIDFTPPMSADEVEAKLNRYQQLYNETYDESKTPQTEEEWEEWEKKSDEETALFYELKDNVAGFVESLDDNEEDAQPPRRGWLW
jgi:hypothetical protein